MRCSYASLFSVYGAETGPQGPPATSLFPKQPVSLLQGAEPRKQTYWHIQLIFIGGRAQKEWWGPSPGGTGPVRRPRELGALEMLLYLHLAAWSSGTFFPLHFQLQTPAEASPWGVWFAGGWLSRLL